MSLYLSKRITVLFLEEIWLCSVQRLIQSPPALDAETADKRCRHRGVEKSHVAVDACLHKLAVAVCIRLDSDHQCKLLRTQNAKQTSFEDLWAMPCHSLSANSQGEASKLGEERMTKIVRSRDRTSILVWIQGT